MKIFLALLFALVSGPVFSQDSWKVTFQGKVLLTASSESEEKNVVKIRRNGIGKNIFRLEYRQKIKETGWVRMMNVYSLADEELYEQHTTSFKLSPAQLKAWSKKYAAVKIYTWYVPTDPDLKQRVRVRRVHLCTIRFV